jgi:hypothetical protein
MPRRRAAVVIGVNTTGGLQSLESAAANAVAVAQWLKGEAFEVVTITDGPGEAVRWEDIAFAIKGSSRQATAVSSSPISLDMGWQRTASPGIRDLSAMGHQRRFGKVRRRVWSTSDSGKIAASQRTEVEGRISRNDLPFRAFAIGSRSTRRKKELPPGCVYDGREPWLLIAGFAASRMTAGRPTSCMRMIACLLSSIAGRSVQGIRRS